MSKPRACTGIKTSRSMRRDYITIFGDRQMKLDGALVLRYENKDTNRSTRLCKTYGHTGETLWNKRLVVESWLVSLQVSGPGELPGYSLWGEQWLVPKSTQDQGVPADLHLCVELLFLVTGR
ncbi:hypothetical protein Tco_0575083 [Tanacetum coccineum]